jgi:hypothetical protein
MADRFDEMLRICDVSREKAALWMEISRAQLDQQLAGDGHISLYRLAMLPEDCVSTLAALVLRDMGLPRFLCGAENALDAADRVAGRRKMARASL